MPLCPRIDAPAAARHLAEHASQDHHKVIVRHGRWDVGHLHCAAEALGVLLCFGIHLHLLRAGLGRRRGVGAHFLAHLGRVLLHMDGLGMWSGVLQPRVEAVSRHRHVIVSRCRPTIHATSGEATSSVWGANSRSVHRARGVASSTHRVQVRLQVAATGTHPIAGLHGLMHSDLTETASLGRPWRGATAATEVPRELQVAASGTNPFAGLHGLRHGGWAKAGILRGPRHGATAAAEVPRELQVSTTSAHPVPRLRLAARQHERALLVLVLEGPGHVR
mmetsp:Transcript_72538/g.201187  ORF Transcript_72538/g.201187 Transcript_72538/m.201187 type:complete len:277 (-) Transcript_72538:222-1052(-)